MTYSRWVSVNFWPQLLPTNVSLLQLTFHTLHPLLFFDYPSFPFHLHKFGFLKFLCSFLSLSPTFLSKKGRWYFSLFYIFFPWNTSSPFPIATSSFPVFIPFFPFTLSLTLSQFFLLFCFFFKSFFHSDFHHIFTCVFPFLVSCYLFHWSVGPLVSFTHHLFIFCFAAFFTLSLFMHVCAERYSEGSDQDEEDLSFSSLDSQLDSVATQNVSKCMKSIEKSLM